MQTAGAVSLWVAAFNSTLMAVAEKSLLTSGATTTERIVSISKKIVCKSKISYSTSKKNITISSSKKRRALGSAPTVPKSMSPSPPVNCKSSNQAPDQESGSEYGSRIAHEYIPGYRPVTRSQGPAPTYGGGGGSGQNLIDFADDPNVNQYRLAPLPMDDQLAYRPKLSKSPLRSAHHPEDLISML